jgi:hypothetical protein
MEGGVSKIVVVKNPNKLVRDSPGLPALKNLDSVPQEAFKKRLPLEPNLKIAPFFAGKVVSCNVMIDLLSREKLRRRILLSPCINALIRQTTSPPLHSFH